MIIINYNEKFYSILLSPNVTFFDIFTNIFDQKKKKKKKKVTLEINKMI